VWVLTAPQTLLAEGDWETTPKSEAALRRGIEWLAQNQGDQGNWSSDDLGLVSMGALAYLSAGHLPGPGRYGRQCDRALDYVIGNAQPSGLLNIAHPRRGMYNHGLSTFVLGQAYGMSRDPRLGPLLEKALRLIAQTQCGDGGWDYLAESKPQGHDLSLAVMQAKALRSAVDSGLDVPPEVIRLAIRSVREHYMPRGCPPDAHETVQQQFPGQFTYSKGGHSDSVAMAAAGVVCLQEFAQYDDWRIEKSMQAIARAIRQKCLDGPEDPPDASGRRRWEVPTAPGGAPLDAYTLYYVGQALYQVGGEDWQKLYPPLRDALVASQQRDGHWQANGRVGGKPGDLYMTSAACFVLAMPNRYLPILQEGKIGSLRMRFEQGTKRQGTKRQGTER